MTTTSSKQQTPIVNALSFDVEEHFQVQAFADQLTQSDWDRHETRVAGNTDRLIDLLGEAGQSATFFTLGWVAQRHPDLVKRIVSHGHELASHGFAHCRVDSQTPEDFRQDVRKTKALLEDAGGVAVVGYRAATFSMGAFTPWAHEILAGEGHRYSSSIYPVKHDLYGAPDAPRFAYCPIPGDTFLEIPITTTRFCRQKFSRRRGRVFSVPSLWADQTHDQPG